MSASSIRGSQLKDGTVIVAKFASGWDSTIIRSDGSVAFASNQSMGNNRLTGVGDAVVDTDAANLRTVQALVNGIAIKPVVRGVAVANRALSGYPTLDGITYAGTDAILLTAQSSGSQNGPWITNSGSWTRPTWWTAASIQKPAIFFVTEGTTYHDTKWLTITDGNITVDTTSISVVQDSSGSTYGAGNGIDLAGSNITVKIGNGIQFDGSSNVAAKGDSSRLVTVDANGVGITDAASGGQIIVGNASNHATWVTAAGDVTVSNTGGTTVNHTAGSGFIKYTDFVTMEVPTGTINGSNQAFTLAFTPQNTSLLLFWNGVLMEPGAGNDYTISGTSITTLFTAQTGDKLHACYRK